ncbi:MAG TPA: enoyl-CoA hydratase-related protein [Alphaproteobacteria bacterium]|nr:enoyl-CoA hydratase-related protein [Alphaproteobacteria bacterium]
MTVIRIEGDAPVVEVVLDRPDRKNAVTLDMWREIPRVIAKLGSQADIRAIILRGAGGNFCAGADITEFGQVRDTPEQVHDYDEAVDHCCDAIAAAPKPVIAAIDGFCVGGGCGLALACDFRIAAPGATIFIPASRLGIVYGLRETQNLLALVGLANAKRMLFAAERLDARTAYSYGFLDEVAAEPLEAARDFAGVMATRAPLSIAGTKALLTGLERGAWAQDEAGALALIEAASQSQDYKEARAAFGEKREPVFKGR